MIGIAVASPSRKRKASRGEAKRWGHLRLREAIETIPEAFVLWGAEDRLVLCNSHFQRCTS